MGTTRIMIPHLVAAVVVVLLSFVDASTVHLKKSLQRNTDGSWLQSSRNAVISKYSRPSSSDLTKRQQTGSAPLTNIGSDTAYYTSFSIGTPAKQYNILLDTGSSDLWLASTQCNTGCGNLQTLYTPGDGSSSYDASNGLPFGVQYIGGNITGYTAHETVSLVGFTVTDQLFGVVTSFTTASTVLPPPVTGLMGLAWQPLARLGKPWWQKAATATPWSQPLFAFSLSRSTGTQGESGGKFSIGELDQTAYSGEVDFVSIPDGYQSWWLIPVSSVAIGETSISVSGQLAAIDTATSFIGGPSSSVAQVYSAITGATKGTGDNEGYWVIPCDTPLSISFNFGSRTWSVSPVDFVIETQSPGVCVGALFEVEFGQSAIRPSWVIGDTFLKNVYSVFRYDPPAVGFASLPGADGNNPSPSLATSSGTTAFTTETTLPLTEQPVSQPTQTIASTVGSTGDQTSLAAQGPSMTANTGTDRYDVRALGWTILYLFGWLTLYHF